jgi:hypothetical protein
LEVLSQNGSFFNTKRLMQPNTHEWIVAMERSMFVLSIFGTCDAGETSAGYYCKAHLQLVHGSHKVIGD